MPAPAAARIESARSLRRSSSIAPQPAARARPAGQARLFISGVTQPRLAAMTKSRITPSAVAAPPAQASVRAVKSRSASAAQSTAGTSGSCFTGGRVSSGAGTGRGGGGGVTGTTGGGGVTTTGSGTGGGGAVARPRCSSRSSTRCESWATWPLRTWISGWVCSLTSASSAAARNSVRDINIALMLCPVNPRPSVSLARPRGISPIAPIWKEGPMPKEWTDKQERKYEHIVESEKDQGAPAKRAKEIAARTVNKERAQKGQTQDGLAQLHPRHVVVTTRRAALGQQRPQGPHQGPALQRGPAARHRRPLVDEQGAAQTGCGREEELAGSASGRSPESGRGMSFSRGTRSSHAPAASDVSTASRTSTA